MAQKEFHSFAKLTNYSSTSSAAVGSREHVGKNKIIMRKKNKIRGNMSMFEKTQ